MDFIYLAPNKRCFESTEANVLQFALFYHISQHSASNSYMLIRLVPRFLENKQIMKIKLLLYVF